MGNISKSYSKGVMILKITSYEKQKHNEEKFNVFVDEKYAFSISVNGWIKWGLYIDKILTQEDIDKIVKEDRQEIAFLKLLDIVSYGMKTEKEIRRKLKEKEFQEEEIEYAIEKGIKYGYVNDEYYVKHYILERAMPNKWGSNKVYSMLSQKGIDKELIKDGIEKYMIEEDVSDNAYEVALKKYRTINKEKYNKLQCKQKLSTFLMGKGYSYDIVKKVVNRVMEGED